MAHELEVVDGMANMVWADTPCWHGLGSQMDPKEGALAWMKAANLDWEVVRQPMFTTLPNKKNHTVLGRGGEEYGVLVRERGTGKYEPEDVFGPVGPDWVPTQNEEVFTFMEKFWKPVAHSKAALKYGLLLNTMSLSLLKAIQPLDTYCSTMPTSGVRAILSAIRQPELFAITHSRRHYVPAITVHLECRM